MHKTTKIIIIVCLVIVLVILTPLVFNYLQMKKRQNYFENIKFPSSMVVTFDNEACFFGSATYLDAPCTPHSSGSIMFIEPVTLTQSVDEITDKLSTQGIKKTSQVLRKSTRREFDNTQNYKEVFVEYSDYKIYYSLPKELPGCRTIVLYTTSILSSKFSDKIELDPSKLTNAIFHCE